MKKYTGWIAFALLVVGTLGLLANEMIFDWGSPATLMFAVFNVVGLALLAFVHWGMKQGN
ncbi:MAG: hypothetical protein U9R25_05490 [Chloroflexota bacterium]|nr:hypothetical protein [Chloroflexota bacterium]